MFPGGGLPKTENFACIIFYEVSHGGRVKYIMMEVLVSLSKNVALLSKGYSYSAVPMYSLACRRERDDINIIYVERLLYSSYQKSVPL